MIVMQLKNMMKSFAGNILLQNIQFEIKSQDRIAIVGHNGAGKSTLLKIMTGEIGYDAGEIFQTKSAQIGYLAQHNDLVSDNTIWQEMITVFAGLITEEKALMRLAEEISGNHDERLVTEYSQRQEKFAEAGGYRYQSDVKGILHGLGFTEQTLDLTVNDLSGGQKTRLALGKLLLKKPDVLILDEPTNHLDIQTVTWLENYLASYPGAIVIVSHDRYFLDKLIKTVYEIAHKQTHKYHGTYSDFLQQKAENYERDVKLYDQQQQEIKETEDFIARNLARASTTKRAQSRRRQLEKMVRLDRPLGDETSASFSFTVAKTSGKDVLKVDDFSYKHAGEADPLFSHVDFGLHLGERACLIGENGIGKTTLLKAILQETNGIKLGTNVEIGYYAQEQEKLNPKNSVLEEVWGDFPHKMEQEIRTILGNFLFSGDDVLKTVSLLSGGERARVALAKLMLLEANFLILDEPTNHLDLASKEVLENALENYRGTILFVSHDRYFINKIADKILELEKDGVRVYLGNYDYFVEKKEEVMEMNALEAGATKKQTQPNESKETLSFHEQKRLQSEERKRNRQIDKIEQEIETLEETVGQLEQQMTDPEILQDHERLLALSSEADAYRKQMDGLLEEWTELQL